MTLECDEIIWRKVDLWFGKWQEFGKFSPEHTKYTYKKPPFIKVAIFFAVILVLNYYGSQEEVINLIPHYLIDIIYKIVAKAITFRKIAVVPNGNKLMIQVICIFSDWILIEQIIAYSHPFCLRGNRFSKNYPWSFK